MSQLPRRPGAALRFWQVMLPALIVACLVSGAYDLARLAHGGLAAAARAEAMANVEIRIPAGIALLAVWFFGFRRGRSC